jgi:hypothetical protein
MAFKKNYEMSIHHLSHAPMKHAPGPIVYVGMLDANVVIEMVNIYRSRLERTPTNIKYSTHSFIVIRYFNIN